MSLEYKTIKIYTSEDIHWQGKPLYEAINEFIFHQKLAARCVVIKGIAECFENGEVCTQSILDLPDNMPLIIEVIVPAAEIDKVLPHLKEMTVDGVVTIAKAKTISFKSAKSLIPKQLKVMNVMTNSPKVVFLKTPVSEIIQLMLNTALKAVPVVDTDYHPLGIITQSDLITKARMPVRLSLLAKIDHERINLFLKSVAKKNAKQLMSQPVVTVKDEQRLVDAVQIMVMQHYKRLPVVNTEGKLVGMLSRIDVFQAITRHASKWCKLQENKIGVNHTKPVKEIIERDSQVVYPDTPIPEIVEKLLCNEIQRVAVVDKQGKFLGLIADSDLLPAILGQPGFWDLLKSKLALTEQSRKIRKLLTHMHARTAAEIMAKNVTTVKEETTIEEAVNLMAEKGLKRLPVVDASGVFKGMIRRDSVLQMAAE
jgi:CBS domain-containing protein